MTAPTSVHQSKAMKGARNTADDPTLLSSLWLFPFIFRTFLSVGPGRTASSSRPTGFLIASGCPEETTTSAVSSLGSSPASYRSVRRKGPAFCKWLGLASLKQRNVRQYHTANMPLATTTSVL